MAKRKIDEQISYNWLFVVLAGGFSLVTAWAVYDEAITRREWKGYQERFFTIEKDLGRQDMEAQQALLEGTAGTDEQKQLAARYAELAKAKLAIEDGIRAQADELGRLESELAAAVQKEFDVNQNLTFTKSEWAEQDYFTKEARRHALSDPTAEHEAEARTQQEAFDRLARRIKEDAAAVLAAMNARKAIEARIARLERADEMAAIVQEMETIRRPYDEAKRRYQTAEGKSGGLMGAKTEVRQQDLPAIGEVDRCESCHLGSARGGFETVAEQVFRTHIYRRTLLAAHPPETFGCTTCHDGQGRATQKFFAHAPGPDEDSHAFHTHYWEFPLLKGPPGGDGTEYMESKCRGCHPREGELRSSITCELEVECATLQPPLAAGAKPPAKPEVSCKVPNREGRAAAEHAFLTLPGGPPAAAADPAAKEAAKVCVDRRGNALLVDLAPHYSRGLRIVEEAGCFGCHPIQGYNDLPKPGPDLTKVAHKLDPGWMIKWIENPKVLRPHTRMPKFWPELDQPDLYPFPVDVEALTAQRTNESRALAAFLLGTSASSEKYTYQLEPIPAGLAGDAARGKELVEGKPGVQPDNEADPGLGCLGCHEIDGAEPPKRKNRASHFDHGPNLSDMGSKASREWIYSWVRDPQRYAPDTRMPNLRLTPQEALDVAEYLGGKKSAEAMPRVSRADLTDPELVAQGKELVKNYGCYGCHAVEGFEATAGIGADLSAFGVKLSERLDFGDFITDHHQQTWDAWTQAKLRHPRVYSYEGQSNVVTRMPQFDLSEEEIRDVMVLLRSLRGQEVASDVLRHQLTAQEQQREAGRALVRWYNCTGCHDVDGRTGEMASLPDNGGSKSIFGPPPLSNEGFKTQPDWLFRFLKKPFRMRPLPKVRMPTFGFSDDQATTLVSMFSAFDGVPFPFAYYGDVGPGSQAAHAVGQGIFDASGCQKCHVVGELGDGPLPPEVKAPNLMTGRERLRAEWLTLWLTDPGSLQKNTAMPAFWLSANPMPGFQKDFPDFAAAMQRLEGSVVRLFEESPQRQIEAVRDYLFGLGEPRPAAGAGPSAAAREPSNP